MLERAVTRIGEVTAQPITTLQGDIRDIEFEAESFDIIMAAAVFHHLRGDEEWRSVFAKCYAALKPGGSIWISDLIEHDSPADTSVDVAALRRISDAVERRSVS